MRRRGLGCLSGTGIIAALITAFSIATYGFASGGVMFSPGPLNAESGEPRGGVTSHAEIAGDCKACHVPPWHPETMDDRCLVCHDNVQADMRDVGTIHGRLEQRDPDAACRDCHPEHNGPNAPLTDIESWKFPHEVTGYWLSGHQLKAEDEPFLCRDCHGNDVTSFSIQVCQECHTQSDSAFMADHQIAFGDSCLNCHNGLDSYGDDFDHNLFRFALSGKHAGLPCAKCHMNSHTVLELQVTPTDCFSCHQVDDPHQGGLGKDCASCHTVEGWRPSHFDHNRSTFKLQSGHAVVPCANCHRDQLFKGTATDCFACHESDDPHLGQLGKDCATCHTATRWQEITFDHSRASFALTGKHATAECKSCHTNQQYRGTPKACIACHAASDAHRGQLGTDCAKCHTASGWLPANFDHNLSDFKLTGLHVNVACASCHANRTYKGTPKDCFSCHAAKDVHNRQFGTVCSQCHTASGWKNVTFDHSSTSFALTGSHTNVACRSCHVNNVFRGTPKNCFACHASDDKHNGQFGTDCASCHSASSWRNVTFDHSRTAFPLTGSHVNVVCSTCHVNGVYRGTPKNCHACHASDDRHNGQFGTDCAACHNTTRWQGATFNHNNTAFPLSGRHTNLNCSSCHQNGVYRGTPKDCFACHANRDAHNGQFGTNCGSCHSTSSWQGATFNHNNAAFPLSGGHTNLNCSSCHQNGVYRGTPTNCYACHANRDAHGGQFGTNCGSCHSPSGWGNATFDHGNTGFPLRGKHAELTCIKCHSNGVYQGTPSQCIACHADKDVHNGENGTDCGTCHTPTDWGNVND